MQVDVVRLRKRGEKLSRDQVRGEFPVRGELVISSEVDMHRGRRSHYALLLHGFDGLLPPLRNIAKVRVYRESLVLVGVEEVELKEGRRFGEFTQAWWCRLVELNARLPRWVLDWIAEQRRPLSEIIVEALLSHYGLEPPPRPVRSEDAPSS